VALDKETADLLEQMASGGGKPISEMTVEEARGLAGALAAMYGEGPEMARVKDGRVRVSGGFAPYRLLVPSDSPKGVIVYYHGGGWVIGEIKDFDALGRILADRTGCAVMLVDYRMAPEYRYPTAVDDSWAALLWVDGHLEEIAGARVPIIVAGDSAGGNLSAVMTHRAKKAGGPRIALQVLVYPVTDCDLDTTTYTDPENQLMLNREAMAWFWDHYAPIAAHRVDPDASPLRDHDFEKLPPAVVLTAEHDVLRDEGELYVARLLKSGVTTKHFRVPGQMHGFFTMVNVLPGSQVGIDFVVDAINATIDSGAALPVGS
jgi:acetyl esterase